MAVYCLYAVEGSNKEWLTMLSMQHYAGEDEEDQLTESEFKIRDDKSPRAMISKKKILKRKGLLPVLCQYQYRVHYYFILIEEPY